MSAPLHTYSIIFVPSGLLKNQYLIDMIYFSVTTDNMEDKSIEIWIVDDIDNE